MLGSAAPRSAVASPPSGKDDFHARQRSFHEVPLNSSFSCELSGLGPCNIVGNLYRVGPGRYLGPWQNPIDGDGLMAKIAFDGSGKVRADWRFVKTDGLVEELKAGCTTRKGAMGTPVGAKLGPEKTEGPWRKNIPIVGLLMGGDQTALKFKNVANTNAVVFNKELWALWEGGFPHCLDPETLATKRLETFDKVLTKDHAYTAHAKIVENTAGKRTMVGLAIDYAQLSQGKAILSVVELDEFAPKSQTRITHHRLPKDVKGLIVHDCSVVEDWVICIVSPVAISLFKLFLGYAQQDFLQQSKGITRVFLLPRTPAAGKMKIFSLDDATHVYHHVGAFVAPDDGRIILDVLATPKLWPLEPQNLHEDLKLPVNRPKVERWILRDGAKVERIRVWGGRLEDPGSAELPITLRPHHSALYDETYFVDQTSQREDGVDTEPWARIVKLSGLGQVNGPFKCQVWCAPERVYVGEPCPVPASDGNGAYVLVPLQDVKRMVGGLAVLDAATMREVSVHWANVWWPITFHGSWAPATAPTSKL